ncbi:MAG: HEAT repeat domain-containing protein [Acidobacteria bacterium]|nr:HEAT repeat domain-containing protein [Acidobacteriota bacterium]
MPFLIEQITEVVIAIVIVVLLGTGSLVAIAIGRRQRRERYFQRIDDLRQRYGPVIAALLTGKLEYERGLEVLKGVTGLDRIFVLEQLCLERRPTPEQVPTLRRLCEDLGLVKVWQERLTGRTGVISIREIFGRSEGLVERVGKLSFLLRARSADYLGISQHRPSWSLLVRALEDPHSDVSSVAIRSLAAIQEPDSFSALVERMHAVVLKPSPRLSLRTIKTALVNFPLKQATALAPSLEHSNRRIRFMATDIIREMVERMAAWEEDFVLETKAFSPKLTELFLAQLCFDENPDVRARAAPVIAYLADSRGTPVLLTLTEDTQWFVRLHAVRAAAKRKFLPLASHIAERLTDPNWMVREAAARTLLVFGRVGSDQLAAHFLRTQDRYSQEQIADEMQRSGLIPTLLTQYAGDGGGPEGDVIEQLADMGKTSYMVGILETSSDRNVRQKFLQNFGRHPDPQLRAWVAQVAERESDGTLRALAQTAIRKAPIIKGQ